jgi:hypothetical protein
MEQKNIFRGMALSLLVNLPALLGFAIILFTKGPISTSRWALGFFLAGFTGVILIVRKESPTSLGAVRGTRAIVKGFVFTAMCWGIALYLFLFGLG